MFNDLTNARAGSGSGQKFANKMGDVLEPNTFHVCALGWKPARCELMGVIWLYNRITYAIRFVHSKTNEPQASRLERFGADHHSACPFCGARAGRCVIYREH